MKSTLPQRMIDAAEVLEELSALYGYSTPPAALWSAHSLRHEAPHVEDDDE